ncbi:hypothetical protein VP1G_11463 [Cytospora mali]|uniref:Uncharacterized protein n=1 Tax=Cytospora mali TaxID=578113 RepID=A0A194VG47_CYTMA|nr:hypothetical protein VP1G_11463 [Valsa mali var. pyri (nom. inval.)]
MPPLAVVFRGQEQDSAGMAGMACMAERQGELGKFRLQQWHGWIPEPSVAPDVTFDRTWDIEHPSQTARTEQIAPTHLAGGRMCPAKKS